MLCQCFAEEILVSYIDLLVTNKSRLFAHPSTGTCFEIGHFPHFQNEAKCTTFLEEMSYLNEKENHFHIKG